MKYKKFAISNFKGIESIELNLTNNRIVTLVGLNESGKTTIMEAINAHFQMTKGRQITEGEKNSYRPKGIDFTGSIEISATIEYENDDLRRINNFIKEMQLPYNIIIPNDQLIYAHIFKYELHNFIGHSRTATFPAKVNNIDALGKKSTTYLYDFDNAIWNKILNFIKTHLVPEVIYYEDFIFSIPEEIQYKSDKAEATIEGEKNRVWQLVLDDIIKVVNPKFSTFKDVIVDVWTSDNETALNRISQAEEVLNKKITNSWKALFQKETKQINFKEIKISTKTEGNVFNVSFKVKTDDGKLFSINDRSKGCRWFFSFLIFTEFRKNRTKNILFLLDEPASNLHSSAQSKILDAIKELSTNSVVIYSTHSHHLINPKWLSGAFIVINDKISDETLRGEMTFQDTSKITAIKYFNYIGKGKGKTKVSYFQPILDALDYAPSFVEPVPKIVITEGKYDWYTFTYFNDIILKRKKIAFYPGAGRDSLWDIIRLYFSWGTEFIVLLDGDAPGIKSQKEYKKEFEPFLDEKIFTLREILNISGTTEELFLNEDIEKAILAVFSKDVYNSAKAEKQKIKELFNASINKLCFDKKEIAFSNHTKENFEKLFDFIETKINI